MYLYITVQSVCECDPDSGTNDLRMFQSLDKLSYSNLDLFKFVLVFLVKNIKMFSFFCLYGSLFVPEKKDLIFALKIGKRNNLF